MRLLVLGGTFFLGRHLVDSALARGHEVTLFNRGQTNPELFPEVERLRGDRESDLSALEGRRWDAAIDVHGRMPRVVRPVAELLAGAVDHFTFVSSISAYDDASSVGLDESTPTAEFPGGPTRTTSRTTGRARRSASGSPSASSRAAPSCRGRG